MEKTGSLFAEERQRVILEELGVSGKVTVESLSQRLNVSAPTVRSDLARLEERGLLRRTHGGAIAIGRTLYEPPFQERASLRLEEKREIARAAAHMVHDSETVLLDAGTTCHEIALCLRALRRLTVVTNSVASALALSENEGIEVVLIGGVLQPRRSATLGALAANFLEPIHCDRAFVAMSGVHEEAGFTVVDFDAAQVKRKMLECAKESIVVADSSKVGQIAFAGVASLNAAGLFLTDHCLREADRLALQDRGLSVMVAGQSSGEELGSVRR